MVDRETQIQELLGSRHDWTPIGLMAAPLKHYGEDLIDLARQRRWRLIGLDKFGGNLPDSFDVRGVLTNLLPTDPFTPSMRKLGAPIVRIGLWPHPDDDQMPAVMPDYAAAGRLAAEHFAQRDFKHVGCIGQDPWGDHEPIYRSLADRAEQLGCQCHLLQEDQEAIEQIRSMPQRMAYRREMVEQWLRTVPRPVGLLAFGSVAADRFCQYVIDLGMDVPRDVAVLAAVADEAICQTATVPISAVVHDVRGIAQAALDTLADLIEGNTLEQTTIRVPPVGIVTRQSTDVLAASDPNVVKALQFMWDHITEDLSVDRIAEHVGVSRRTLARGFGEEFGRGVNAEFQRRRLEKARQLIAQTDLPIGEIANLFSFSSPSRLSRVFKETYGQTPAQFRRDAGPSA